MDNEVIIHVKVKKDDVKQSFEAIGKDAETQSKTIANKFSDIFTERLNTRLRDSRGRFIPAGQAIGDQLGDVISQRVTDKVTTRLRDSRGRFMSGGGNGGRGGSGGNGGDARVDVDIDKQSILSRLFSGGKEGAAKFADGFKDAWGSITGGVLSGDLVSSLVKGISVAGLAALLAPVLGAALAAAFGLVAGGGFLAVAIAGAFKDPIVLGAAKGTLENIKGYVASLGKSFTGPVENFFVKLGDVFRQIAPMVKTLADDFGPVATVLSNGLIGLLQNALPGILRAADGAAPIVQILAEKLPMIGDSIGRFFDHINRASPDAMAFLGDFLELIGLIIRALGILIEALAKVYGWARKVFLGMVNLAADFAHVFAAAFWWVPGLGPKLVEASRKVDAFRDHINSSIEGIHKNVNINIRINVVGLSAARAAIDLGKKLSKMGMAHGGIVGAATGGLHGGLRMVGEHGPELVELPPGTRVNSAPDTERMMGGGGGGAQTIIVPVYLDGRQIATAMVDPLRADIRRNGAGSVQKYLGQAGVS